MGLQLADDSKHREAIQKVQRELIQEQPVHLTDRERFTELFSNVQLRNDKD